MLVEERHQKILDMLREKGRVTVSEIQDKCSIGYDSAKRDLRILEEKGLLKRTYGGAMPIAKVGFTAPKITFNENFTVYDNYREIAVKAASFIKPSDAVYLTGGSFGQIMLEYLPRDFHYTVVVNSAFLANSLKGYENIDLFMTGGKLRHTDRASCVDSLATAFIEKMHFDLCFITGAGLSADFGLTNGTDETATFQRAVIKNSRNRILLMPCQKIGVNSFIKVAPITDFDTLITDWNAVEDELGKIEEAGVEVVVTKNPEEKGE